MTDSVDSTGKTNGITPITKGDSEPKGSNDLAKGDYLVFHLPEQTVQTQIRLLRVYTVLDS